MMIGQSSICWLPSCVRTCRDSMPFASPFPIPEDCQDQLVVALHPPGLTSQSSTKSRTLEKTRDGR